GRGRLDVLTTEVEYRPAHTVAHHRSARPGLPATRSARPPHPFHRGSGGGCVVGWGWGCGVSCGAGGGVSSGSGSLARPGRRATLFGAPPHFLVGRECGGVLRGWCGAPRGVRCDP